MKNANAIRPIIGSITKALLGSILLLGGLNSFAQGLYPLKAGNPSFSANQLSPEMKAWYARLWGSIKNPNPDFDPSKDAASGDNYRLSRSFEIHMTSLLDAFRLTGDLNLLDEMDRLLQIARTQLRDAWDDGTTDGFLNWRNYTGSEGTPNYGTDNAREIDEILLHSMLAEVTWAFRLNQNLTSPHGILYKSRADFWQNYLSNHFEAKWRSRRNIPTGFPFLVKNLHHIYVTFIRYHYYMGKLTGRTDYLNEANRMAGVISRNICAVQTISGTSYSWPHIIYFDPKSGGIPSTLYAQPEVYVRHTLSSTFALAMEGFAQFGSSNIIRAYAGGLRDFILDGRDSNLMLALGIAGDTGVTGTFNGGSGYLAPQLVSSEGTPYTRTKAARFLECPMPFLSMFDSTGKLVRTTMSVYHDVEMWNLETPGTIFGSIGMMFYSANKAMSTPPQAPSHVSAIVKSPYEIDLSWSDDSSNESGFKIERSFDSTNWSALATVPANSVRYIDTQVHTMTRYYYRIKATNTYGDSESWGFPVTGKTPNAIPKSPNNLVLRAASSNQIDLSWNDLSDNEDTFKIEYSTDNINWHWPASVGANVTKYSHKNLVPDSIYYYRISAVNSLGISTPTVVVSARTNTAIPAAPFIQSAQGVSTTQVKLTWLDNSLNESGFRIYISTDSLNYDRIAQVNANITSAIVSNLKPGIKYYFKVHAYNAGGDSFDSNIKVGTTLSSDVTTTTITPRDLLVDFGSGASQTTGLAAFWNNVTAGVAGTSLASLVDSKGVSTAISLQIKDGFCQPSAGSSNTNGTMGSTIYPPPATHDSFYLGTVNGMTDDHAEIMVTGLSTTKTYTVRLYASRMTTDLVTDRTTVYTINGIAKDLQVRNNQDGYVEFPNAANGAGSLTINIDRKQGSLFGYLGVLELIEN